MPAGAQAGDWIDVSWEESGSGLIVLAVLGHDKRKAASTQHTQQDGRCTTQAYTGPEESLFSARAIRHQLLTSGLHSAAEVRRPFSAWSSRSRIGYIRFSDVNDGC